MFCAVDCIVRYLEVKSQPLCEFTSRRWSGSDCFFVGVGSSMAPACVMNSSEKGPCQEFFQNT